MNQKIIIAIVATAILAGAGVFVWKKYYSGTIPPSEGVYCTADAKQCPDGSYVGRVPPNCEFAACPSGVDIKARIQ